MKSFMTKHLSATMEEDEVEISILFPSPRNWKSIF